MLESLTVVEIAVDDDVLLNVNRPEDLPDAD